MRKFKNCFFWCFFTIFNLLCCIMVIMRIHFTCVCLLWRALHICLLFCIWIPFVCRYSRSGRIIKAYSFCLYDFKKPVIIKCLITNLSISFVSLLFFIPHFFCLQVKQVLKQCESLYSFHCLQKLVICFYN